jgi:hypothetical protein
MSYTKLFSSIITSTIWSEDDQTRIVWISMLAIADKNGEVQGSVPGLARIAGVSVDDTRAALHKFLSPDPDSRTRDDEGRRIEPIDGGWQLLNHAKYRAMASKDEAKLSEAKRKARYRAQKARNNVSQKSPEMSHAVPDMSHDVPENPPIADSKANPNPNSIPKTKKERVRAISRMIIPVISEVEAQATEIGLDKSESSAFYNYYESIGWKVGRNPMKSWKHSLAGWKNRNKRNGQTTNQQGTDRNRGTWNDGDGRKYDHIGRVPKI